MLIVTLFLFRSVVGFNSGQSLDRMSLEGGGGVGWGSGTEETQ